MREPWASRRLREPLSTDCTQAESPGPIGRRNAPRRSQGMQVGLIAAPGVRFCFGQRTVPALRTGDAIKGVTPHSIVAAHVAAAAQLLEPTDPISPSRLAVAGHVI